jgi:hypothetical protein
MLMFESVFTEKLNWFKQNEKPEAVLVIADNPELIKIVIAWSNIEVRSVDIPPELPGNSENEAWDWLWENIRFSLSELKAKTGVTYAESVLKQKMEPLIGNRILYPDGSVNTFVQRYLRSEVARLFETKPRKTTRNVKS